MAAVGDTTAAIRFPIASGGNPAPSGEIKKWVESKGVAVKTKETKRNANDGNVLPGQTLRHPDGRSTILSRAYCDNLVVWEYCVHCKKVLKSTSMDKHLKVTSSAKIRCRNHPYFASADTAPAIVGK